MMEDQTFKLGQVVQVNAPHPFAGWIGIVQTLSSDAVQVAFGGLSNAKAQDGTAMLWLHESDLELVKK